ncbi:MAG: lipoyl(octanoyl) transferase LipB [Verrucomicrobiales bacterium]
MNRSRTALPTLDFRWLGRLPYDQALLLQHDLVEARRAGRLGDTVLLLEHDPVYTIGRTPDKSSLAAGRGVLPHPVVEISRGGQATYHGPGQLVGYPVIDLQARGKDLHRYLRALELALIGTCEVLGVPATRREDLTGVWVGSRKLASIGVGVRHWISLHGFALNVTPQSLEGFHAIIPCGLAGVTMTCLADETGMATLTVEQVAEAVQLPLHRALDDLR